MYLFYQDCYKGQTAKQKDVREKYKKTGIAAYAILG